ncbi:MAG TPA: bifunctional 4-hydroxy-2-oxoglutarate aldolase/2-dehydro-3-deoxy-phosphogluconate aldolase [Anaerolineae bacterium]|nr:bifunctional 4-hydroxy-2-oxoglutarate aldolase/2-dehydro-3-deoxy-phosphogluconate aldolase [Anaerolineae bacterium]
MTHLTSNQIWSQITRQAIIAILPRDLPLNDTHMIADALAATPVCAVQFVFHNALDWEIVRSWRQRSPAEMLLGLSSITTLPQAQAAIAAGAQFLSSFGYQPTVHNYCQQHDILYLSGAATFAEVQQAVQNNCTRIKLFVNKTGGFNYLRTMQAAFADCQFMPTGYINPDNIAQYAQANVPAIGIGRSIFGQPPYSMRAIISRARALQKKWDDHHPQYIHKPR